MTGDIPVTATTPGLPEAREILRVDGLSENEKQDYYRMLENLRYQRSVIETGRAEGREEGRAEANLSTARNLKAMGLSAADIAKATGLTLNEVNSL